MSTLIAIDGGNSKTEVLVCDTDGRVLARTGGPGTNHQTAGGYDTAMRRLDKLVRAACRRAGLTEPAALAAVYLAGADLPAELATLTEAVGAAGWAVKSIVDNDALALLRAGTSAADAVAVVCGAGINCVGRAADGRAVRFPALGTLSGDWGGGVDIGALALWHACRAEDGRGPRTELAGAVAAYFGLASASDVAAAAHQDPSVVDRLGELSPVVFAVAGTGDEVARSVVVRQGEEVVALACAALNRLDLTATAATVVLGGGVLRSRDPLLFGVIREGVRAVAPRAELTVVTAPPVLGAALLGLAALGAGPAAERRLRAGLDT
jgi:N-acetylglucosamine kinase-like BadF-type ATPase